MRPYALIDLHCDTLTDCMYAGSNIIDTLDDPARTLSLTSIPKDIHWAQFFAVFVPDELRGEKAIRFFDDACANFDRQMRKFADRVSPCRNVADMERAWAAGKTAAFLSVENGSAFAGDLSRIGKTKRQGVCAVTLTWNGENELGSGNVTDRGLTDFGRAAVREMERCGILIDVSHLNDAGLADVFETAERPFLATHSNARAICAHKRNLTDVQIKEMVRRGCLIGLNYYGPFLRDGGAVRSLDDVYRHVAHFFDLGARKNLALGSDFDGAVLPPCLDSPEKAADFYEYLLLRGVSQQDADGIFFENARTFLRKTLGERKTLGSGRRTVIQSIKTGEGSTWQKNRAATPRRASSRRRGSSFTSRAMRRRQWRRSSSSRRRRRARSTTILTARTRCSRPSRCCLTSGMRS